MVNRNDRRMDAIECLGRAVNEIIDAQTIGPDADFWHRLRDVRDRLENMIDVMEERWEDDDE